MEVICRLYADGKLGEETMREIDANLSSMRFETLLYFGTALSKRKERDQRFAGIIRQLKNPEFQLALIELGESRPLGGEEL